jgi:hypothetical protein
VTILRVPRSRDVAGVRRPLGTPPFTSGIVRRLPGAASVVGSGRDDFPSMGKIVRRFGGM